MIVIISLFIAPGEISFRNFIEPWVKTLAV